MLSKAYLFKFLNKLRFFSCGKISLIISKQKSSFKSFKTFFDKTSFLSSSREVFLMIF